MRYRFDVTVDPSRRKLASASKIPRGAEELLDELELAPAKIATISTGLDIARLTTRTASEPWSANDILGHLRACQDVRAGLVDEMLVRDSPTLRYVSPRTYIRTTPYLGMAFQPSFNEFARDRASFVEAMRGLTAAQWARSANLKGRRVETALDCLEYLVVHEAPHLAQMRTVLDRLRP